MHISLAHLPKPLLAAFLVTLPSLCAQTSELHGDSWCGTLMCVSATVNASTVTYQLKSLNQLGWMAIGFGHQMINTPLVMLWLTTNGTIILSQRQATGLVEPLPVTDPPRQATVALQASVLSGVSPILAFDMKKNNDSIQSLVWAFGVTVPPADPSASIEQHLDAGNLSLNLTKELANLSNGSLSTTMAITSTSILPSPTRQTTVSTHIDSILVAHAALSAAGFLIFLPLGTLVARWMRVFTPKWFTAHWLINVVLGIPLICVGWALGPLAVARRGLGHIVTSHQISGVVLFALYIFQVALGTVIHLRRPKTGKYHPPRNVTHVALGLVVFALSIYTTISGVVRNPAESSASQRIVVAICIGWAAVFAGSYSIGLIFLRKQFAQERLGWNMTESVPVPLPLALISTASRASSEDVIARRMAIVDSSMMADDGTHDIYSPATWESSATETDGHSADRRTRSEMRQVQAMPVSLSAFT